MKAVSKNKNVTRPVNLVEILLGGKVKYQKIPSAESEYIEFYDDKGEMVATYSNTGWTMYTTNAEAARQTDMCMAYNAAWRDAKNGANAPAVVGNPAVADGFETTVDRMA